MWVIADIAIARDDGPFGPGPDASTRFPARFDIDYIRMWSKTPVQNVPVATLQGFSDPGAPRNGVQPGNAGLTRKAKPEYNKKALAENAIFTTLGVSESGKWMITVTGTPGPDFKIVVTGKNGNLIYESTDAKLKEHYFPAVAAGEKHQLKIRNNGSEITHQF
jgi:hypothetical protein